MTLKSYNTKCLQVCGTVLLIGTFYNDKNVYRCAAY